MTSFAFTFGVIPLALASGAGAEMRRAIGTAVFFGMLGVTFFGVFLTPVFYVTLRRLSTWMLGRRSSASEVSAKPQMDTEATDEHRTPPLPLQ